MDVCHINKTRTCGNLRIFHNQTRAPRSRRHFTERASLEVRTRDAHRRDGYRRERRRVFFSFLETTRAPALRWTTRPFVRSFVRSINQSINRRRERVSDSFRDDHPTGVLSFFATRRMVDGREANDATKRNSFYLNPFASSIRSFVVRRSPDRVRGFDSIGRSVDRTLDRVPRRRRGAKSGVIYTPCWIFKSMV